jgi:hypothetical protein
MDVEGTAIALESSEVTLDLKVAWSAPVGIIDVKSPLNVKNTWK